MILKLEGKSKRTLPSKLLVLKMQDRTFGLVKCYPAVIDNKVKGALVTALRSHYDVSVLEIIAPVCLRKQLNLKDGVKVKVEIFIQP